MRFFKTKIAIFSFLILILITVFNFFTITRLLLKEDKKTFVANEPEQVPTLPLVTLDKNNSLGIPAYVEHLNHHLLRPYMADRKGLEVIYTKHLFAKNQTAMIYIPKLVNHKYLLIWQTSSHGRPGLVGIYPSNKLILLDNKLYDFGVGVLFVKVYSETANATGYTLLSTIIGETTPTGNQLWSANDINRLKKTTTISFNGIILYPIQLPLDQNKIDQDIAILKDPASYVRKLNGGLQHGVHPVVAANTLYSLLIYSMEENVTKEKSNEILDAAKIFFENYVFKEMQKTGKNAYSWPYNMPWMLNWGIKLDAPWYSSYDNAVFAESAAIMYQYTHDEKYKILAEKAANYILIPIIKGGSMYEISGFKLPAEYVYNTPPLPNVEILDGEFIALTHLYNTARLLGDSRLLHAFIQQAISLTAQMPFYEEKDGKLYFSKYIEDMPAVYKWLMWSNLQSLANIMKDRTLLSYAKKLHPNIPEYWVKQNGN